MKNNSYFQHKNKFWRNNTKKKQILNHKAKQVEKKMNINKTGSLSNSS